jgi:tetratricopeptide (TPR) repeat protein/predicted Ser/Thr protein kinase
MSTPGKGEQPLEPTLPPERPLETPASASGPSMTADTGFPIQHWDRYEFLELLGRGGMGEVYKARDRRLDRIVALKFIRGADPDRVMRLLQEARAQARINHPNVCKVYEVGEAGGKAYIAMQFVGGHGLDRVATEMALSEKVQVLQEVSAAVHEAHRLGVIHRDLKPSNIMVERSEDGRYLPVVMDFGLAYEVHHGHGLTQTGALMGTPSYMAPEQARGETRSIDRRSDVYSLGATLYELLAGVAPFTDATAVGTLAKVLHEEPPPLRARVPHLASDLETIVLKCVSKEPDQRYPSARALAEDLGRYMDGEPILGRRPSLLYRLRRYARKHRSLVVVSAASLAAILILSALGLRSWVEARQTQQRSLERARLAEQMGQQVKEIEWFLRAAYLLPLHDTSQEQQLVRESMARIAGQQHELGDHGEGLVHYALGRGHLAMHEFEKAHEELSQALSKGIDSPELHYARGRVLGELYHQAMENARHRGDKEWVAKQQPLLERQYLEPALQSLERSRGLALESPQYLEGLIAFYRRQYDAAARAAERASAETSWVYEARKLAGDVAYTRAMEHVERGRHDEARARLEEAGRFYERAIEAGRSDAQSYEALAETWLQRSVLDEREGRTRKEALEYALAASARGLQADPKRAAGYTKKAFILMRWYDVMRFEKGGLDPQEVLSEWTATAARGAELNPGDVYALDTLGFSHYARGLQEAADGKDPFPAWDDAIACLRRALQLQPFFLWGHNDLALVYRWKGNYQREHGQDPHDSYAQAEHHLRQAVQIDPIFLNGHTNLADLYGVMARYNVSRGINPETEVQKALLSGKQALSLNGNLYSALNETALAEVARARYLVESGGDPRPSLKLALKDLEHSIALKSSGNRAHYYRAQCYNLAAAHALRENSDPGSALAAARQALAEADRQGTNCVDCRVLSARLGVAEATWAKRQGQPVKPILQRALAEAWRAVEIYHSSAEAHQELARIYGQLAAAQPKGELLVTIKQGLEQADQALQLNPVMASVHAIRASLLLLQAKAVHEPAGRLDSLRQAQAALTRAFELNPLLRREYEEPLREVELLLSQTSGRGSSE